MMKVATLLVGILILGGCSSIKEFLYKDKCTSGNWEPIGEQDGQAGKNNFSDWGPRCEAFNTKPDAAQYEKGFARGMQKYCFNSAMNIAKTGQAMTFPSKCETKALKDQYQQGYTMGIGEFCSEAKAREVGLAGQARHESCVKLKPYANAYNDGLNEFCTTKRAFAAGTEGAAYDPVNCSAKQKTALQSALQRGTKMRETKASIATLEAEITDLQKKLYDASTPADAKTHYQSILTTKQSQLKAAEKELYKMEGTRI